MHSRFSRHAALVMTFVLVAGWAQAQELKFNDYRSAMSAASGLYRSGNLAASRPAFEAAVKLARNDLERKNACGPLIRVYAEGEEFDKMFETAEQVVELTTHKASVSMTIRSLLGNCQRKNQLDAFRKRYEGRTARQPEDRLAINMMAGYHSTVTRDFGQQAKYLEQLVELDERENKPADAELMADLAFAYRLAGDYQKSAALYGRTAPLSRDLESWCYMEQAVALQQAGQMPAALAAAGKAHDLGPDSRSKQSLYRWHRSLGEVFLAGQQKEEALSQLTSAREAARIDAYKQQCAELIEKANAL